MVLFGWPGLGQSVDNVRAEFCEFIVDPPGASKSTDATLGCRAEGEKGHNVTGICMKHLFVGSVSRGSDFFLVCG